MISTYGASVSAAAAAPTIAGLDRVKPHVKAAAEIICAKFGISKVYGWRAVDVINPQGHPAGLAVDFPCDKTTGDALAAFVIAQADGLAVNYVIWRQRIWRPGRDWKAMSDGGSPSANHMDHVHVQFNATAGAASLLDRARAAAGAAVDAVTGAVTGAVGDAVGSIPAVKAFAHWDTDAAAIGLKLAVVGAGLTLVTLGVWRLVLPGAAKVAGAAAAAIA